MGGSEVAVEAEDRRDVSGEQRARYTPDGGARLETWDGRTRREVLRVDQVSVYRKGGASTEQYSDMDLL